MDKERLRYASYLLRMWQVQDREQEIWRASLEYPQTGHVIGFSDLASLFSFLEAQTGIGGEDGVLAVQEVDSVETT